MADPDEELGQGQRQMWAAGDYPEIAEMLASAGAAACDAATIGVGDRVLDVACGPGNAALQAAARGAEVTGLDLTPELLAAGTRLAAEQQLRVEFVEGDAEALPFGEGSYDVVVSTFGCMFAPGQQRAADEIARVLRPGGRLGLASWTAEGSVGGFFRTIGAHLPPAPGDPPVLWGDPGHVRSLFEGSGLELESRREAVRFEFESIKAAITAYETKFGPVIMAKAALEPEGRWQALRDDLSDFFKRENIATDGTFAYAGEYLLLSAATSGPES